MVQKRHISWPISLLVQFVVSSGSRQHHARRLPRISVSSAHHCRLNLQLTLAGLLILSFPQALCFFHPFPSPSSAPPSARMVTPEDRQRDPIPRSVLLFLCLFPEIRHISCLGQSALYHTIRDPGHKFDGGRVGGGGGGPPPPTRYLLGITRDKKHTLANISKIESLSTMGFKHTEKHRE